MNTQDKNLLDRGGIVLGLTMAEIFILIVFCLLLLLANILDKKNNEINELKVDIQQKDEYLEILNKNPNLISNLKKLDEMFDTDSFDDAFKELILINKKIKSSVAQLKGLQEKIKELHEFEEVLQKNDLSINETVSIIESIQEIKKTNPDLLSEQESICDLPNKIEQLQAKIKTEHNRMIYLQKKLERLVGKGTEKPACWATSSGRSEYIFDMVLTSHGIIINDNKLPDRIIEQAELPLKLIHFNQELNSQNFRIATQALYDWSNKNECCFFVKVFDKTKQNEKSIYKKRLRVVGEHFYYFEPLNENPSWIANVE